MPSIPSDQAIAMAQRCIEINQNNPAITDPEANTLPMHDAVRTQYELSLRTINKVLEANLAP